MRLVFCLHTEHDHLREVHSQVTGFYGLEDVDTPVHQFLTKEAQREFEEKLVEACQESMNSGQAEVEWYEEWLLYREPDAADGRGGVSVIAVASDFLESASLESVNKAIDHASGKFLQRKSNVRAAVAMDADNALGHLPRELLERTLRGLGATDVEPLEDIFLVSDGEVRLHVRFAR